MPYSTHLFNFVSFLFSFLFCSRLVCDWFFLFFLCQISCEVSTTYVFKEQKLPLDFLFHIYHLLASKLSPECQRILSLYACLTFYILVFAFFFLVNEYCSYPSSVDKNQQPTFCIVYLRQALKGFLIPMAM